MEEVTYSTTPNTEQAALLCQTNAFRGFMGRPITVVGSIQKLSEKDARDLDLLCMRAGISKFTWEPPLPSPVQAQTEKP